MLTRIAVAVAFLFGAVSVGAQDKFPAETKNAALRYWMAFAQLQDAGVDDDTAKLIQQTLNGESPWNEARLGRIVADNIEPIQIMQRATKLPECDWGLEYSLGPAAPIFFVQNSARALGRINTLYGIQAYSRGDSRTAIDSWLAGVHFSQDLARGGSLLASLVAKANLNSSLRMLAMAAASPSLKEGQRNQITAAIRALPESGFDWGQALAYEGLSIDVLLKDLARSASPPAFYLKWFDAPAPVNFAVPLAQEIAAAHQWLVDAEAALRLPPDQAVVAIKTLQASRAHLHPLFQVAIPNIERVNEARNEVATARQQLLQRLASR